MALYRQGSDPLQDWNNLFGPTCRSHDHGNMRQVDSGNGLCRVQSKFNRGRKLGRAGKRQHCSIGVLVALFFGLIGLTLLGNHYRDKGGQESSLREEFFDNQGHSTHSFQNSKEQDYTWAETDQNVRKHGTNEILQQRDGRERSRIVVHESDSLASRVLRFGQVSTGSGQDSRYWDRDDRRRDGEYDKKGSEIANMDARSASKTRNIGLGDDEEDLLESGFNSHGKIKQNKDIMDKNKGTTYFKDLDKDNISTKTTNVGNGSLYNEQSRHELKIYEAQYEADMKEELDLNMSSNGYGSVNSVDRATIREGIEGSGKHLSQNQNNEQVTVEDEYDDGIDDDHIRSEDNTSDINLQRPHHVSGMEKDHGRDYDRRNLTETESNLHRGKSFDSKEKEHSENAFIKDFYQETALHNDPSRVYHSNNFSETQRILSTENSDNEKLESNFDKEAALFISGFGQDNAVKEIHEIENISYKEWPQNVSRSEKLPNFNDVASWKVDAYKSNTNFSRRKRRKPPRLPCEVGFLNSTDELQEPEENRKFSNFSLEYVQREEKPDGVDVWKPRFAGHQSLDERENSFSARDQKLHCGFVKGPEGSSSTGFDLNEEDANFLRTCHIAVSSCIFGNSDNIRTPPKKKVTQISKKNVCFVMFVDEKTLETLSSEGRQPDENGHIGLWKVVVVRNLPYPDMRRTGKVPKLLAHRLFPSARYSIWIDSKMRLNSDPLLILEYFLWRGGFEYAISNHYDRHCVWEEVTQNKRLNKFNHTVIDEQFASYRADGLTKFNESDPNKLLPSYVPEGSFIVRAHTPLSNLFSCLWFNEVDRFTPRDQLSFAYTFLKLRRMNPESHFWLNMFKDCERRSLSKLFHHRTEEMPPYPRSSKD